MKSSNNSSSNFVNLDILKRLNYIYDLLLPNKKILQYSKEINKLIHDHKLSIQNRSGKEAWSEKTVLLITYADSINTGFKGKALNDLSNFYNDKLNTFIDSIHILPFFPASSDGGFSVMGHDEVDKKYGKWADIKKLAKNSNIMTDLVINHASSEGLWYKNFLKGINPGKDYFYTVNKNFDISKVVRPRDHELLKKVDQSKDDQFFLQ